MSIKKSALALVVLVVLIAGCSSPTHDPLDVNGSILSAETITSEAPLSTPVTREALVGTWRQDSTGYHLQFAVDGTFRMADSRPELETSPFGQGEYGLEGDLLTFASADAATLCPRLKGRYQVHWLGVDQVSLILVEDPCGDRAAIAPQEPLVRVTP